MEQQAPWLPLYEDRFWPATFITETAIEGSVPARLRGVHYRVGPMGGRPFDTPLGNAFADADGFVGAFLFTEHGVSFRGDVVRTRMHRREQTAGKLIFSTFSTVPKRPAPARLLSGLRGMPALVPGLARRDAYTPVKDSPNHVPCVIGDRLLVIGGAGMPFALNAPDLSVAGPTDFAGALPRRQIFLVGESHLDPNNGDRCFLEICTFPTGVRLWSVDPGGRGRGSPMHRLPHVYLPHDFGLTATKVVIPAGPIYASFPALLRASLGFGPMNDAFIWHPTEPTRYYVIDRRTGDMRVYEAPPSYPVHIANAFDDNDDVVLDMNIHSTDAAVRGFTASVHDRREAPDFTNRLVRLRLAANGNVEARHLVPFDCEVPFTSEIREGMPSRYVYACATARGIAGSPRIVKVDATIGEYLEKDYGEGCVTTEPVFVPDPAATAEDGGWILCQVYDSRADQTFLSILDAARFESEVARVRLPVPLPYLLHGKFVPA